MAIDCSDVPSNITYNCTTPWGLDCKSRLRFDFQSLWDYTQSIQKACPTDSRLFLPKSGAATHENAALTQASCEAIAGADWTRYPATDIWTRMTTWKFPLLQLVAIFPRPPLSLVTEILVLIHLLGDPIDTVRNLLLKLSTCQDLADYCRRKCSASPVGSNKAKEQENLRDWKAMALLIDAYSEWGNEDLAKTALHKALNSFPDNPGKEHALKTAIRQTGNALAADRATKSFPIIVALVFFIGTVGIAVGRTRSAAAARSDTIFVNVEVHGIAFSVLFFWIIPAVILSSVIGVSQTKAAIPRILGRLQDDVPLLPQKAKNTFDELNKCLEDDRRRIFCGGIYSWQPSRWQWEELKPNQESKKSGYKPVTQLPEEPVDQTPTSKSWRWLYLNLLAHMVVILGTVTGVIISTRVPPEGWNCRVRYELGIGAAWVLSAWLDPILNYLIPLKDRPRGLLFWSTAVKDLLITIATLGGIIATLIGVLNRCSCYTALGKAGLALPEQPDVAKILDDRLGTVYPGLTFACIGVEAVFIPLGICLWYRRAIRVFIQRDDDDSNVELFRKLQTSRTSNMENGHELQNLITNTNNSARDNQSQTEGEHAAQAQPLAGNGSVSHSSGIEPPSPAETHLSTGQLRRRPTESQNGFDDPPQDPMRIPRKPVAGREPPN